MLQHISSGSVFEDAHDIFLAPLNEYVADAGRRFGEWFLGCKIRCLIFISCVLIFL